MLPEYFTYVSVLILVVSGLSYIVATIRGETQPNRVTWFFWGLAPIIGAVAAWSKGVGISALPVLTTGIIPLIIFFVSFVNKKAYWQSTVWDYACGVAAGIGLVLWYVTTDATLAIVFSILADFFAALPTIKKAYTHPESENEMAYLLGSLGMFVALFSVQHYSFDSLAFIAYTTLGNTVILAEIYIRKRWGIAQPSQA